MFSGLGTSVRSASRRVSFEDAISWAIEFLVRDDRIVWYLSLIQRFAYLRLLEGKRRISRKLLNKMNRKLSGFEEARIKDDVERFSESLWEHFASVQAVYSSPLMLDYRFHEESEGRQRPKSVRQILQDFSEMERMLEEKGGGERFCNDGEAIIRFSDGWAWFVVKEGVSRQEAMAMRHCGNGDADVRDLLYSLREPVRKPHGDFWKPHLTFIIRNGYLGEMKGFANQKPAPIYHEYVKELLQSEGVRGIRGGGYLPQNNFQFLDLEPASRIEVLEKKPSFDFDLLGDHGKSILRDFPRGEWKHFVHANCPEQAMSCLGLQGSEEPEWLAFQSTIKTARLERWNTSVFCAYDRGCVGKLHFLNEWTSGESLAKILKHPMVRIINESLLVPQSTWDKVLEKKEWESLMIEKPGFFRNTPLSLIFENFGCAEGVVEVINDQHGLNLKWLSDGVELLAFSSVRSFARRTGVGSLMRKSQKLANLPNSHCSDLFRLGWLTFRKRRCSFRPFYLHLHQSALAYLFLNLELSGRVTPKQLMKELVYRFGPPDIFEPSGMMMVA